MAYDPLANADLLIINDQNLSEAEAMTVLTAAPLMSRIAFDTASYGNTHKWLQYSGKPVVGFRDPNDGRDEDSSVDTAVSLTCKILDCSFSVDIAVAESYKDGVEALLRREAVRHLAEAMFVAESGIITGTTGLTGLAGLHTSLNAAHTIGAGGTTATTGSSCYLIRSDAMTDCAAIWGNDGRIEFKDPTIVRIVGTGTTVYPAYYVAGSAWFTFQYGGGAGWSSVRIANCTEDSGKGLTDDLIARGIALFPAAKPPNLCIMNRRSWRQLQDSRTATNPTGAPAPFPDSAFGIPIVISDNITSTETLLT